MIYVKDMSCEHCVATMNKVLKKNKINGEVNLPNKTIKVDSENEAKVIELITEIGYEPVIVEN
jgi:copper chaperone CopZ